MNFLELCNEALGLSETENPGALRTLKDATAFQTNVVNYVRESWKLIQTHNEGWGWRHREFQFKTLTGKQDYAFSDLRENPAETNSPRVITDFRKWNVRRQEGGGSNWYIATPAHDFEDHTQIADIDYLTLRRRRFGLRPDSTKPSVFAVTPDLKLAFHPTPDDGYMVSGLYVAGVQILNEENEIPQGIPDDYQSLIVWRAVMMIHANDNAAEYAFADGNYRDLLQTLSRVYRRGVEVAGALQ